MSNFEVQGSIYGQKQVKREEHAGSTGESANRRKPLNIHQKHHQNNSKNSRKTVKKYYQKNLGIFHLEKFFNQNRVHKKLRLTE